MHKLHTRSCSITDLTQIGMVQLPRIPVSTHMSRDRAAFVQFLRLSLFPSHLFYSNNVQSVLAEPVTENDNEL